MAALEFSRKIKGLRGGTAMAALLVASTLAASAQDVELNEVVVTSPSPVFTRPTTPAPAGLSGPQYGVLPVVTDAFSSVTVVPRAEIERAQPATLGDALFEKPGISASTYAPGASRPIIRGLDNNRVAIQENGIGVHDVSNLGEDHGVPIDPLSANQIEVIRGPATLRYGSQAIGGVVSVTNNRIPTFIPLNGYSGNITTGISTIGNGKDAAASFDAGSGNVAIHADGFKREAGDYNTPLGKQLNSAINAQGGSIGASYVFDRGFVGVSMTHYDALYHIPGTDGAASRTRIDLTQDNIASKGEYRPESGYIQAIRYWLGGTVYKHNEIGIADGVDGIQATFKNREVEGRVELQHVPYVTAIGTLNGAIGAQFGRRQLGTSGEAGSLLAPTDTRTAATYLFEELELTKTFKLQAAGRIEHASVSGTASQFPSDYLPAPGFEEPLSSAGERKFAPKSVSIGALQQLPWGMVASLTAQYVERAPAAPELYSRGPHDATATFEIGDPNLKKETARSLEFGLRRAEGPFRFDASIYYTRYTGFIYKRLTGAMCGDDFSTCGIEEELQQIVYSQRNARFYGADFIAQYDVLPVRSGFVGVDARYDFVNAKFDDGSYVPRIPPHRVGGGVYFREGEWYARVGLLHAFAQNDTATEETRTPGYNLLKAELSYTKKLDPKIYGASELTFGVIGDNLLNDKVRNASSFLKDEVLLPGRNGRLFLTARF